jgi:hypothetical protein
MSAEPRPAALLLCALGLLAGLVWLWGPRSEVAAPPAPESPTGPPLEGEPSGPQPRAPELGGEVQLVVTLETRALLRAPPAAPGPPCRLIAGEVEVPAGVRVLAGARAAAPQAAVGGWHLVRFDLADGSFCRAVQLRPDEVVEVGLAGPALLRGSVERPDGAPLEGASVWAGAFAPDGSLALGRSTADGSFELEAVRGGRGIPCAVWAEGFASRWQVLDLPLRRAGPLRIRLAPAAAVDVVLTTAVAEPERAEILIAPRGGDVDTLHYPFFLDALRGGRRLSAAGTATIADLPVGARVEISVAHPGLASAAVVGLRARADRPNRAAVGGEAGRLLSGTVREVDGRPLAGAELRVPVSAAAVVRAGELLPPAAHRPPGPVATSGVDGRYRIAVPAAGPAAEVEVVAAGRPVVIARIGAAGQQDFVVPAAAAFERPVVLRLRLRALGRTVLARRAGSPAQRLDDRAAFEVPLDQPALCDLQVRVVEGGRILAERRFDALAITGPVELAIDA